MARAVAAWSPVIMTVRTPAVRHVSTASRTSGRGGSIMPTMPTNTRSRSMSSASSGTWGRARVAKASTRSASSESPSATASAWARSWSSMGRGPPSSMTKAQRGSSPSSEPLTAATTSPSRSCTVAMRLRSESKGRSARRG